MVLARGWSTAIRELQCNDCSAGAWIRSSFVLNYRQLSLSDNL